jgi:hypothetical protein
MTHSTLLLNDEASIVAGLLAKPIKSRVPLLAVFLR